jgi:diacylglycerol kinase (ATP)
MATNGTKLLFIVNPGSGTGNINWKEEISKFFADRSESIEILDLPNPCKPELIIKKLKETKPARVIAVGGDGTVKLVANAVLSENIPLAILPAGSANGMAKELNIPDTPELALETVVAGVEREIHLIKINDELCIHLSDIGFNAYVIKKFEEQDTRGMWGYVKAAWKVLWQNRRMQVKLNIDGKHIALDAAMVVIANATMYGNGVVINPGGSLYDELFEVVIIRKISFTEIFKMRFTQRNLNPEKTQQFQTRAVHILSRHSVHFQVDGEIMGKVKEIEAKIIPRAIRIITPAEVEKA